MQPLRTRHVLVLLVLSTTRLRCISQKFRPVRQLRKTLYDLFLYRVIGRERLVDEVSDAFAFEHSEKLVTVTC